MQLGIFKIPFWFESREKYQTYVVLLWQKKNLLWSCNLLTCNLLHREHWGWEPVRRRDYKQLMDKCTEQNDFKENWGHFHICGDLHFIITSGKQPICLQSSHKSCLDFHILLKRCTILYFIHGLTLKTQGWRGLIIYEKSDCKSNAWQITWYVIQIIVI